MIRPKRFVYTVAITALVSASAACTGEQAVDHGATAPMGATSVDDPASAATSAQLTRVDFTVQGMDCGGCVLGTRAALRKVDGVRAADAAYDDATKAGSAWALYDPAKTSPERMIAAIGKLGYTATPLSAGS